MCDTCVLELIVLTKLLNHYRKGEKVSRMIEQALEKRRYGLVNGFEASHNTYIQSQSIPEFAKIN